MNDFEAIVVIVLVALVLKPILKYCCPIKLGKSYFPSVTCCK